MTSIDGTGPTVGEDASTSAQAAVVHALQALDQDPDCIPLSLSLSLSDRLLHDPQCCCGDVTCKFLSETAAAFDRLDESLRTAGRLGQALLVRHETYVAEAETERKHMRDEFDRLNQDKSALQTQNTAVIQENRQLLEQLESANSAVTDTDAQVRSLTATLHTAQEEIQRLNSLARRTQALERELEQFELEQSKLQSSLASKTEQERVATLRWQSSERTLAALEDRVEAIEFEARSERQNHMEILARIERQRALEKELDTAAGRSKGAAAARNSQVPGNGVVSHFVKDILQDNANLQMSVVELREMLTNANEEVERLREQLLEHIPATQKEVAAPDSTAQTTLSQELPQDQDAGKTGAQEVHVHHHYHAPQKSDASRRSSQLLRRPKKRRQGIQFGQGQTAAHSRTPSNMSVATLSSSLASPPISIANHRWSMQSAAAQSSVPSSPRSYNASLFDRSMTDLDSSRPTTPGTEVAESPYFQATHRKRSSVPFFQPLDEALKEDDESRDDDSKTPTKATMPREAHELPRSQSPSPDMASEDEEEEEEEDPEHSLVDFNQPVPRPRPRARPRPRSGKFRLGQSASKATVEAPVVHAEWPAQTLNRAASHQSLLSVSGMDIHTLKSRPSQMLTGQNTRTFSSQSISATTVTATRPTLHPKSSQDLLSSVAAEQGADGTAYSATDTVKRVSGWMFGRWGTSSQQLPPSPLSATHEQDLAVARPAAARSSSSENTLDAYDNSIDNDDVLEGADFTDSGRGGAEAESAGAIDYISSDEDEDDDDTIIAGDSSGEKSDGKDADWRFGVYNPFG